MAEFQITDQEELSRTIKFIQNNPENKRSTMPCSEHPEQGEQPVIIIDDGPEQPIRITGCCRVAIDKNREQIEFVGPFAEL